MPFRLLPVAAVLAVLPIGACRTESHANGADTLTPSTALPGAAPAADGATKQASQDTALRDTLGDTVRDRASGTSRATAADSAPRR